MRITLLARSCSIYEPSLKAFFAAAVRGGSKENEASEIAERRIPENAQSRAT